MSAGDVISSQGLIGRASIFLLLLWLLVGFSFLWVVIHSPTARHPGMRSQGPLEASLRTKLVEVEFQLSYFNSWKMMLWKCCTQYVSKFGKLSSGTVFIPIPKKGNAKKCSNYHASALISHNNKVTFKIIQVSLQQYVNHELPDVLSGFRKGRGTRDSIANICWIIEKEREFQKNIYFCFIDYAKAFDCVDHN